MIAIISDSHIPKRAEEIPEEFYEVMEEAEKLVHCGDFETEEIHGELDERYDELVAVKGNNDFFDLPVSETFTYNNVKFGVYHGSGINPRGHPPTLAKNAERLDSEVLLHGHTHVQSAQEKNGKILLNPGSCTGLARDGTGIQKMMVVRVEDEELVAELLRLENGELRKKTETFET